jgi:hypothetical protein
MSILKNVKNTESFNADQIPFLTDAVVIPENCQYAFREVKGGYPLEVGEAYLSIPVGREVNPMMGVSRNLGNARSASSVGQWMSSTGLQRYKFYVMDEHETNLYRKAAALNEALYIDYKDERYRPVNSFGESYDLIVYPNGHIQEDFDGDAQDTELSWSLRYYKLAETPPGAAPIAPEFNDVEERVISEVAAMISPHDSADYIANLLSGRLERERITRAVMREVLAETKDPA